MTKKTLLVDCDTGVDDAIALLYLLADPDVEICAITTVFGNISAGRAAQNSLCVLDVVGATGRVPVAVGSELTFLGQLLEHATFVHGANGMGGVELAPPKGAVSSKTAVELIVETVRARPGEVHLLATAPLTNVAAALRAEPRLPELVEGITVMGGAAMAPGNITPAAEANIWHDPEAAQAVVAAPWPITLVPLDATMGEVITERQRLQMAESSSPVAKFAAAVLDFYLEFYTDIYGKKSSACHDVLAAGIAVDDIAPKRSMKVPVSVETGYGPARGATVCDTRGQYKNELEVAGANCTVVLETGGDFSTAVVERLCSWQPPQA